MTDQTEAKNKLPSVNRKPKTIKVHAKIGLLEEHLTVEWGLDHDNDRWQDVGKLSQPIGKAYGVELKAIAKMMVASLYPKLGTENKISEELDEARESAHDARLAEYQEVLAWTLDSLQGMSATRKMALRASYIYARKSPEQERDNVFQTLILHLVSKLQDIPAANITDNLCCVIARNAWANWYKLYNRQQHYSIDETLESDDDGSQYRYDIANPFDPIAEVESDIDTKIIYDALPRKIRAIVTKRLKGKSMTDSERKMLKRYTEKLASN